MDYTNSLDNTTDPNTGHRMHQDDQAVTTVWSAQDANGINWELMEILKAGGIDPKAFNKDDPQSYNTVLRASKAIMQKMLGNNQTAVQFGVGVTTNLTAGQAGSYIQSQGGTVKLPASTGLALGTRFTFSASALTTITVAAGDSLYIGGASVPQIDLDNGDFCEVVFMGQKKLANHQHVSPEILTGYFAWANGLRCSVADCHSECYLYQYLDVSRAMQW